MKYADALKIIGLNIEEHVGYIVMFYEQINELVYQDHFPEILQGEKPIDSELEAIHYQKLFANETGKRYFDIHIAGIYSDKSGNLSYKTMMSYFKIASNPSYKQYTPICKEGLPNKNDST